MVIRQVLHDRLKHGHILFDIIGFVFHDYDDEDEESDDDEDDEDEDEDDSSYYSEEDGDDEDMFARYVSCSS